MYCCNAMSFDHKNVGVTYQRMMSRMFGPLLEKLMDVYIGDILVKSKPRKDHLAHLCEAFQLMRLPPTVESGKMGLRDRIREVPRLSGKQEGNRNGA